VPTRIRSLVDADAPSSRPLGTRDVDLLTRLILAVGVAASVYAISFGLAVLRATGGRTSALVFVVIAAILAAGLTLAQRFDRNRRIRLAVLLCWLGVAAVAAEGTLLLMVRARSAQTMAERRGTHWDGRTRAEVIRGLQAEGVEAFADLHGRTIARPDPSEALDVEVPGGVATPLAAAASRTAVVLCNESGEWVRYVSDERGFRNPPGSWGDDSRVDLMLVGDSYTMGVCQPDGLSFADRLRARWPRTLNLGVPGAGPLIELGTLKEFGASRRPALVLWVIYEWNDLTDLVDELAHPILPHYLTPGYRQGLAEHQVAVDSTVRGYLRAQLVRAEARGPSAGPTAGGGMTEIARQLPAFRHLRTLAGLSAALAIPDTTVVTFRRVIAEARRSVDEWGGTMVGVYLPTYRRYVAGGRVEFLHREEMLAAMRDAGIGVVDLVETFDRIPRADTLWTFADAHYTTGGNALLASVIGARIGTLLDSLGAVAPRSPGPIAR
jgi:hypothetical protein